MKAYLKFSPYLLFLAILFVAGCDGCEDDELPMVIEGDECIGGQCMGVAECQNGYCNCPDPTRQLARGFCIQNYEAAAIFVNYDQHEGIIDTMIISLVEEPFDLTWQVGDPTIKPGLGKTYNRHPDALTIARVSTVMQFIWPGDFVTPVDTVWISNVYDKSRNQHSYRSGGWLCRGKTFVGRFVDRDHIVGNVHVNLCAPQGGDSPRPPEIANEINYFPVTFTRLRL